MCLFSPACDLIFWEIPKNWFDFSILKFFQNSGQDSTLSSAEALVFMVGVDDDSPPYSKSNALQVTLCLVSGNFLFAAAQYSYYPLPFALELTKFF